MTRRFKIDDLDLKIIRELQKDARKSFRDVAAKLKIAEGTVYNRVKKLEEMGVIKGYVLDIDYAKLGFDIVAVMGVVVEGAKLVQVEREISRMPETVAVYDVTGTYDVIVIAKFHDTSSMNNFVKRILGIKAVQRTYTMVVLNVVKESPFLTII
ncbi:AsnC family transcriptional regulator [Candidatus Bathyarchaeota archaeon ex4484_205]|nr:MAG: AsnC family transcriptional regulator [Candidatus Bathyarchaeota archaeon ex4484_205]